MKTFLSLFLLLVHGIAAAQTASPMTPPPVFPQAAAFDPKVAPGSAREHAAMVRIPGGTYPIGSPAQHPLANKAAMPEHKVELKPFRLDRREVTNAQFAEFLNALPVKPTGTALGGKVTSTTKRRASACATDVLRPIPATTIIRSPR
jgi:formylglycine-generating enzyme required for sulfatase activity